MNQILYTGGKKGRNGTNSDMRKILIIFAVFIILFAICAIAIGGNLLSKVEAPKNEVSNNNTNNTTTEDPIIQGNIEIKFSSVEDGVKLNIISDIEIATVEYCWDEEELKTIELGNETEYETVIPTKQGTHTLKVYVVDIKGNEENKEQLVIGDTEPEVTIGTDKISNYVVKAKDDEQLTKIIIKINEETQEIEINDKEFEISLPIPEGDSIIDVTAYNLNGLSVNKKAKVTNFKR